MGQLEVGSHVLCAGAGPGLQGPHVGTVVGHRTAASGERYFHCHSLTQLTATLPHKALPRSYTHDRGGEKVLVGILSTAFHSLRIVWEGRLICMRRAGGNVPSVSLLVSVSKNRLIRRRLGRSRYLLCRWYYRPEETLAGRQPFDGCSELLESDHVDIVPHSSVLSRCRVLGPAEYTREREVQTAAIRSAREEEFFEQHPVTDASRVAAEPWSKTFGNSPTAEEVELLNVMQRLLRRVQSEVRPDECRRSLLDQRGAFAVAPDINEYMPRSVAAECIPGLPNAATDVEEFPAPPNSKAAKSRKMTL